MLCKTSHEDASSHVRFCSIEGGAAVAGKRGGMGRHRLPFSPPAASDQQRAASGTSDDARNGFDIELAYSRGILDCVSKMLSRVLSEIVKGLVVIYFLLRSSSYSILHRRFNAASGFFETPKPLKKKYFILPPSQFRMHIRFG
jgi:hypothetical protein